ncbi:MAG: sensor histidine kinase [Porticoccaceae bacterium]
MKSIRTYLVVVILSVICLANFTAAMQGYRGSLKAADHLVEQRLDEKIHTLSALIDKQIPVPEDLFDEQTLYQIWDEDQLVSRSVNAPEIFFAPTDGNFHLESHAGDRWRAFGKDLDNNHLQVIIAEKYSVYSSLTEDILLQAIIPIIWVLPILGLLVWIVIQIGIQPLKRLADNLSRRDANDFNVIDRETYAGELVPIVSALNGLFSRLSDAFDRERRFSSDAAHELRTPLAAFKVNLHSLGRNEVQSEDLDRLKRTAERMEHSIEQLLTLNRVAYAGEQAPLEACDLRHVARDVIADMYVIIGNRNQTIELEGEAVQVMADPGSLAVVIRNLIDNASKYSPEDGIILVSTQKQDNKAILRIEDSGQGIPEEEHKRVLERFYRVGGDQNDSEISGTGLGLSIVSYVLNLYGGKLNFFTSRALGGLGVEIVFPLAGIESA